ncbi:GSCOCG00008079001-RA-CDS [Cotesia congregata]|nr:GSCOCG00008079001-RA-CDS [Cotesia congregata]
MLQSNIVEKETLLPVEGEDGRDGRHRSGRGFIHKCLGSQSLNDSHHQGKGIMSLIKNFAATHLNAYFIIIATYPEVYDGMPADMVVQGQTKSNRSSTAGSLPRSLLLYQRVLNLPLIISNCLVKTGLTSIIDALVALFSITITM